MIDDELLAILACPLCRAEVTADDDRLVCSECGRRYPVRDGIPVMLVEEAEVPEGAEASDGDAPPDAQGAG